MSARAWFYVKVIAGVLVVLLAILTLGLLAGGGPETEGRGEPRRANESGLTQTPP
jgi:hypothetical protein